MNDRVKQTPPGGRGRGGAATQAWLRLWLRRGPSLGIVGLLLALFALGWINLAGTLTLGLAAALLLALLSAGEMARHVGAGDAAAGQSIDPGLTSLIAALPVPCFLLDRGGIVLDANPPGLAALRLHIGDSVQTRIRTPEFLAAFDRVAGGGAAEQVEHVGRPAQARLFAAWLAPLGEEGARARRIALVLDDRTELRRVESVRADFVANASHELRTPLASLTGFIETLQGPARDDPAARERFLAVMHEQAGRMSRLVDDLLSLSRVEMASAIRPGVEVDLSAVVKHVADALAPLAKESGVEIVLSLPDIPVRVPGNRDELVQLVENLVENACRYGAAGKRVELALNAPPTQGGESVFSVRDFGPGIPPEHLPRLTERFYRVDVEASRKHRGTGLGLAIVKHIATRHNARLRIESRIGVGALFAVHFAQARSGASVLS